MDEAIVALVELAKEYDQLDDDAARAFRHKAYKEYGGFARALFGGTMESILELLRGEEVAWLYECRADSASTFHNSRADAKRSCRTGRIVGFHSEICDADPLSDAASEYVRECRPVLSDDFVLDVTVAVTVDGWPFVIPARGTVSLWKEFFPKGAIFR